MTTKTITGSYPSGYALNATYLTLNIAASAIVGGAGVTTVSTQLSTINNLGTVQGTANGITLSDGGAITNGSATNATALIQGTAPIVVNGASATIKNYASLQSEVDSSGFTGPSVTLNKGGTVTNFTGGQISNGIAISAAAGTVTNDGLVGSPTYKKVSGSSYYMSVDASVSMTAGGTVTNGTGSDTSAVLSNGIDISGEIGNVVNNGAIYGPSVSYGHGPNPVVRGDRYGYAVICSDGGSVTNGSTNTEALIDGGVEVSGGGTVVNHGTISGSPGYYYYNSRESNTYSSSRYSVSVLRGGSVTNGSASDTAATITHGVYAQSGTVTAKVINFATIDNVSTNSAGWGISMLSGGTIVNGSVSDTSATIKRGIEASRGVTVTNFGRIEGDIAFGLTGNRLIEEGTGFVGEADGNGGATLELAGSAGPGALVGLGTVFNGFATVTVDKGASWSLSGPSTVAKNTVLSNSGTLDVDGQMVNSGQINNLSGATFAFDGDYSITTDPAVKAGGFANMGLLEKTAGTSTSTIRTGTASLTDTGTIDVETGTLELTGATVDITGKIIGAGTIAFGPGSTTLGAGSTITTADFTIVGTGALVTMTRNYSYAGSFSAGTGTELAIATGDAFSQNGPASFFRDTLDIDGRLTTKGATSASVVTVDGTGQWYNTGTLTETNGTLILGAAAGDTSSFVNQAAGEFDMVGSAQILGGAGTATFTNQGLLSKMGGNTSMIALALANTGTVEAAKGTLDLQGAVSGKGTLKIDAGQVLQADAAIGSSQTVQFNGGGDKLVLTDAAQFSGKLQNFGSGDKLDLRQFDPTVTALAFTENAAMTQGTLTVTDGALQAKITLLGQYSAAQFHTSSDGLPGGTFVTYTPQAATLVAPLHS